MINLNQLERTYTKHLENLRLKLIKIYEEEGIIASGKYADDLEWSAKGTSNKGNYTFTMWGANHSFFIENGRAPGKFPRVKDIENWIEVKKGLPAVFKEKKEQFAFIIARNIAEKGIQVPNKFNKGKVVSRALTEFLEKDVQDMIQEMGVVFSDQLQNDIIKIFKEVA
ncbi:hypothetical protein HX096_12100 [Empedobacter falsenii]|uniref:hypothetical protein n=1 Tax=Empedobacter falsenii TaxID=343874 RepID=UPI002574D0AB|nr:hypothetical protein [Empedobacter falsenii]MDM1548595.1 hypothetical protein [Empedobacter falsenii]